MVTRHRGDSPDGAHPTRSGCGNRSQDRPPEFSKSSSRSSAPRFRGRRSAVGYASVNGERIHRQERRVPPSDCKPHVSRRAFLAGTLGFAGSSATATLLGGCNLALPGSPSPAKAVTIGFLSPSPDDPASPLWRNLSKYGWTRGDNLSVEYRAGGYYTYSVQAPELASLGVALIVAQGESATHAARQATDSIPIVMLSVSDAIGGGLVASLARPGGNITGLSLLGPEIRAKGLDLLRELSPGLSRVAVLWHPAVLDALREYTRSEQAAHALNIELLSAEADNPSRVSLALALIQYSHPEALIVLSLAAYIVPPAPANILSFAATQKIPAIYTSRGWVTAGGLISYGVQGEAYFERAAVYIDKILRGASPADLPVEQPTAFDLVVNTRTAQSLGLVIPASVAAQVTEWI
jgi:putative ABC transport system substrate-binding protein